MSPDEDFTRAVIGYSGLPPYGVGGGLVRMKNIMKGELNVYPHQKNGYFTRGDSLVPRKNRAFSPYWTGA